MKRRSHRRKEAYLHDLAIAPNHPPMEMRLDQPRVTEASISQAGSVGRVVKVPSSVISNGQSSMEMMMESSDRLLNAVNRRNGKSALKLTVLHQILGLG